MKQEELFTMEQHLNEIKLMKSILHSQKKYTEIILNQDMSKPEFFLVSVVALIDEIYELYDIIKDIKVKGCKVAFGNGFDFDSFSSNNHLIIDELVDVNCFVGNLITYFEQSTGQTLEIDYYIYNRSYSTVFRTVKIEYSLSEWLAEFNQSIRTLIRFNGDWKNWKLNNKRKTAFKVIQKALNLILYLSFYMRKIIYQTSRGIVCNKVFYDFYQSKVILNIKKQLSNKTDLERLRIIQPENSNEDFLDSFFIK